MKIIGDFICKHRKIILILTILMIIPSIIGIKLTRINYDILVYLPDDIETIKGQNVLTNDFDMGAFSVTIIENMQAKDILKLENKIKEIDGVANVVTVYDAIGNTIPLEMLPDDLVGKVKNDNADLMFITFNNSTSDELTLNAIEKIKEITDSSCKIGGMSAMVLDTMNLSEKEIIIYVVIAVNLCLLILEMFLDSYLVPPILLLNIGIAILFNLGTNIIFGEISYITKALVAVLQLGVTTDFSIFLYHSYEKKKTKYKDKFKAMSEAISETFTSVVGSSLTTIAGFLVLCSMTLKLGTDLGLVMAKGVLLGVICVLTVFPCLLLACDKYIEKTKHKEIMPRFNKVNNIIVKYHKLIFALFIILFIPAYLANCRVDVYYKLDESLPKNLDSIIANQELKDKFNIVSPEIILLNKNVKASDVNILINEIANLDGIDFVISFSKLSQFGITSDMLSEDARSIFESDKYQIILLNSTYDIATSKLNNQINDVNNIIKKYDKDSILAGEGPLMNDLVSISDHDFTNVNNISIVCILIIMIFVLKSFSLPFLLILSIEFAIFINMAIPYFGSISLPFVAPIVLGTIQLGATIDYAILMTTTYLNERKQNKDKYDAIKNTLDHCITSIIVSGLCFFSATFGVGIYSDLEMISSLCTLISRGAIISMIVVIMILPSILLIFDKIIIRTNKITKKEKEKMNRKMQKASAVLMLGLICYAALIMPASALTKEETVYAKMNYDGSVNNILVTDHLINNDEEEMLKDITDLENIVNINGNETFIKKDKNVTWNSKGNDIFYQGTTEKEMPVKLDIKYYLDDTEHSFEDMLGKQGKVTIKLKYQNNAKQYVNVGGKKTLMYTPFVVTMATIIDSKNNSNININNGRVINNGTKSIVVGLASPGLYESLGLSTFQKMDEISMSYETNSFELSSIYSAITPKIINKDDLKIFNKLDSLYSNVTTLQSSINDILDGAKNLDSGIDKVNNGSSLIYQNLNNVTEKIGELKDGAVSLDKGLNQVLKSLKDTKKMLNGDNVESISSIKTLISKNTETISKLKTANKALKSTYDKYNLGSLTEEQIIAANKDLLSVKISYESSYDANASLIELLNTNNIALNRTLASLENTSKQVNELINKIEEALIKIEKGANSIVNGTAALKEGTALLTKKTKELVSGTSSLKDGSAILVSGIKKYNKEGISKLNNFVNVNLKTTEAKIKSLVNLGESYDTFTDKDNKDSGTAKFIMVVNSKKVPVNITLIEEPKEKENFWIKLKNLFK